LPWPKLELNVGYGWRGSSFAFKPASPGLASYSSLGIFGPAVQLDFFPLAFFLDNPAAAIGIFVNYFQALGLHSVSGTSSFGTTLYNFDVGLTYHWRPIAGSSFYIGPDLGVRFSDFGTTVAGKDAVDGLPDLNLTSFLIGVGSEIPVGSVLFVTAKLGFAFILSAGEIIGPNYYGKGSAWGIDARAGVGANIVSWFFLRLEGTVTNYSFSLSAPNNTALTATGADQLYAGATLFAGLRL
jgi:hypothetical protein